MLLQAREESADDPPKLLLRYYSDLLSGLGPQGWWPGRTRLEVILGAILTQNTSWKNVESAMKVLRKAGFLKLSRLTNATRSQLEACVRPAGFFRQKTLTIKNFLAWLGRNHGGSLTKMFALPADQLRNELLALRGVGPETADAILLYAGGRPFFVADAYTRRVLVRHGMIPETADYSLAQDFLHRNLPRDDALFNEFHALLVEVGKRWCGRAAPRCEGCPLRGLLPAGGTQNSGRDQTSSEQIVEVRRPQSEPFRQRNSL